MSSPDLFSPFPSEEEAWEERKKITPYCADNDVGQRVLIRPKNPSRHSNILRLDYLPDFFALLGEIIQNPYLKKEGTGESSRSHDNGIVFLYYGVGLLQSVLHLNPPDQYEDKIIVSALHVYDFCKERDPILMIHKASEFTLSHFLQYRQRRA
ncbi:MAG TPA: hypothetical protein VLH19_02665 [Patescibacteria group bacterium]|nr:hypothetical protein [Patescibacteria group bacterium]